MKNAWCNVGLAILLTAAGASAQETGWLVTTDYSTFGGIRSFTGDGPYTVSADLAAIPGDAVGRHHGGLVYVVGRGQWNLLQIYDPADGFSLVREFSLGTGRNPQDVAFDDEGDAYVSCYDQAVLLRVDPAAGTVLDSYSTAGFADADGLPETGWMARVGDRLYITCQKLDRDNFYLASGPGALLVFDTVGEQWVDMDSGAEGVQPIALQGENPYTNLVVDGDRLTVGCAGYFGLADGGVETVDLVTGLSQGFAVTEAALGGDVNRLQRDGEDLLAVVNDGDFNTFVTRSGAGGVSVLDTGTGFVHADILLAGGRLYVGDRTVGAVGLRVLDPVTGAELTTGPVGTGLPPFLFVARTGGDPAATPPPPVQVALRMDAPAPNPCNPAATVALAARPGQRITVEVVDLRGRRVRRGSVVADAAGAASYRFDGRDGAGRALAAGVYRLVARTAGGTASRAVTLLK